MKHHQRLTIGIYFAFLLVVVAIILLVGLGIKTAIGGSTFESGYAPRDTHSGTLLLAKDGNYYLYGETDGCGFRWLDPETQYCGVHVFHSRDLIHWSQPSQLIDTSSFFWKNICMGTNGYGCWRPKVVFNSSTGKYVMWLQALSGYVVLTSNYPDKGFVDSGRPNLSDQNILGFDNKPALQGDQNLFVDNSSAWLVYNRSGRLLLEKLDPTYTQGVGSPLEIKTDKDVEAPALFKRNNIYYITLSDPRCAYCSHVPTAVLESTDLMHWTPDGAIASLGQPNGVTRLRDGRYLISFDQWHEKGVGTFPRFNETPARQYWAILRFNQDKIMQVPGQYP